MDGPSRSPADPPFASPPATDEAAATCRDHLDRVLGSRAFAHAPVQQRFLRYVVEETLEGRGDQLKELVIGTMLLGRGPDYDPHQDATVRVAARRLRQKLREYYEDEGRDEPVRILLKAGSYRPDFEWVTPPQSATGAGPALPAPARGRWSGRRVGAAIALTAVAAAAAGAGGWALLRGLRTSATPVVAVLPFHNATGDPENAYLSFGLTEELITALARNGEMRVVARTSTAQFSGGADIRDVAGKLGATAVVEGSVRGEGDRFRITAQLIRGRDGSHLWAETYDRDAADLFGMQEEVAREVTDGITRQLLGRAPVTTRPAGRISAEAVAAYWRGRYQRSLRTVEGRRRSLELFEAAVTASPEFAAAHAAAGEVLATMAFHAEIPTGEGAARAHAASRRALALDERLALAHATLGWLAFFHDRDWPSAERGYRRALELNPSDASARQMYAHGLAAQARHDEAVAESETAAALDPLSYATSADLAAVLYNARRFDECVARAQRVLEANPSAQFLHGVLGSCEIARGRYDQGRAHLDAVVANFGRVSFAVARLGLAHIGAGDVEAARRLAAELEAMTGRGDGQFTHLALLSTALGNRERALAALAVAVDRREGDTAFLAVEPVFDPLRGDPRFTDLLRRLGLPVR